MTREGVCNTEGLDIIMAPSDMEGWPCCSDGLGNDTGLDIMAITLGSVFDRVVGANSFEPEGGAAVVETKSKGKWVVDRDEVVPAAAVVAVGWPWAWNSSGSIVSSWVIIIEDPFMDVSMGAALVTGVKTALEEEKKGVVVVAAVVAEVVVVVVGKKREVAMG
jgi:hypothetical protein